MTAVRKRQQKVVPLHRVEVRRLNEGDKPFGWVLYRRGEPEPIARSEVTYQDETAAWNGGGSKVRALEHEAKSRLGVTDVSLGSFQSGECKYLSGGKNS
jgi:hypothetical protein